MGALRKARQAVRVINCYRLHNTWFVKLGGFHRSGFTYGDGPATDNVANNGGPANFNFRGAQKLDTNMCWPADFEGAFKYACKVADYNNKVYGTPVGVAKEGILIYNAAEWVVDEKTGNHMRYNQLEALLARREKEELEQRLARLEAEKTANFESEIR